MKYRLLILFLFISLLIFSTAASETNQLAFVNASTSDRVHLREDASSSSDSLGLYFSGTPAFIPFGNGYNGWTYVVIGAEQGYIKSDLLLSANQRIHSCWKIAEVNASGWVNLRSAPTKDAPVLEKVTDGATVTVLGETASKWCYVYSGSQYGYIMSRYLRVGTQESSVQIGTEITAPFYLPADFYFSSGAGAWSSQMTILPNGQFWGYFHDADMGDSGPGYPQGTLYECSFTGYFSDALQINEYEYQIEVESLQSFGIPEHSEIKNQTLTITVDHYGVLQNEIFSFFFPHTPNEQIPREASDWRKGYVYGNNVPAILYGHNSDSVWRID